jgi:hypothetical protein
MSEELADLWLAAWASQAARDGIERDARYWDAAWDWIADQRSARRKP